MTDFFLLRIMCLYLPGILIDIIANKTEIVSIFIHCTLNLHACIQVVLRPSFVIPYDVGECLDFMRLNFLNVMFNNIIIQYYSLFKMT